MSRSREQRLERLQKRLTLFETRANPHPEHAAVMDDDELGRVRHVNEAQAARVRIQIQRIRRPPTV